jgi:MFS family permease
MDVHLEAPNPRARRPPLPGTVWLFGLASLLNDASSEAVFPLLGIFLGTLGAPMRFVGLVLGLADALAVGIKVGVGHWSDRLRRKPLVIAGYLVAALGRAALTLAVHPWQVLAARSLDRAGKGIRSGPRDAMLADAVPASEKGRAYGINQSLDHVGAAVGPLIAWGGLKGGLSLRAIFGIASGLGLLAPVVLFFRLREVPRPGKAGPVGTAGRPGGEDSGGGDGAAATAGTIAAAGAVGDRKPVTVPEAPARPEPIPRSLAAYLIICGLFALANSSDAFILIRAGDLGWAPATLPLLWLVHHVVKSVTTAVGGALSDRIPRVFLIAGGWAAYAGAYAGFAFARQRWHVLALLMCYAIYHGLAEAPERALVSDLAPSGRRGFAFGLYHGVVGFAALPAGLLTGWIWDRAGAGAAFGVSAALAAVAAIALGILAMFGSLRPPSGVSPPA